MFYDLFKTKRIKKCSTINQDEAELKNIHFHIAYEDGSLKNMLVKTIDAISNKYPSIIFKISEKNQKEILKEVENKKIDIALVSNVIKFPKDCGHTTLNCASSSSGYSHLQITWNALCTPEFRNDFITRLCDNYSS